MDKLISTFSKGVGNNFVDYFESNVPELNMDRFSGTTTYFKDTVRSTLVEFVMNLSYECIIEDYHIYLRNKGIKTNSINERIAEYLEVTKNDSFFELFFTKFPVLKEKIIVELTNCIQFIKEIVDNFNHDKSTLKKYFKTDMKLVDKIILSAGDKHEGKSVAIVQFSCGYRLVYKPREASTDKFFTDVINLFNKHESYGLKTPKLFNKETHSWHEHIDHIECTTQDEVEKFYYRCGVFLSIFYLLGTTDLHFENLIAHGEYPYFIDLETIFSGDRYDKYEKMGYKDMATSVLATSLLPLHDTLDGVDVNISALFTENTPSKNIVVHELVRDESYDFAYSKVNYRFIPDTNRIILNNEVQDNPKYLKNVSSGFLDGGELILKIKHELLVLFERYSNVSVTFRQLFRPTYIYSKFLDAAKNPKIMSDFNAHKAIFEILRTGFQPSDLGYLRVNSEINDLLNGDIPYFHGTGNSTMLYHHGEELSKDYFVYSPILQIINRLENMEKEEIEYQNRFICLSKFILEKPYKVFKEINLNDVVTLPKKEEVEKNILDYCNKIYNESVRVDETGATLFNLNIIDGEKFSIKNLGFDMYNSTGLVCTIALCGFYLKEEKFVSLSEKFAETINIDTLSQLDNQEIISDISVFNGIGGLLHLNCVLFKMTSSSKYGLVIKKLVDFITSCNLDIYSAGKEFLGGISGTTLLLYNIKKTFKNLELTQEIESFFHRIKKNNSVITESTGLAHGSIGNMINEILISETDEKKVMNRLASEILKIENIFSSEKLDYSWCSGKTGYVNFFSMILKNTNAENDIYKKTLEMFQIFSSSNNKYEIKGDAICHGSSGILNSLIEINHYYNNENDLDDYLSNIYISDLKSYTPLKDTEYDMPSFMLGSSGIAYSYLRYLFKDAPNILNMEF